MNTVKVLIKQNQVDFLLKISTIKSLNDKLNKLSTRSNSNFEEHYELNISLAEIEEILDILTYHLAHSGIEMDGRVNKTGLIIEDLIDLFSKYIYEE